MFDYSNDRMSNFHSPIYTAHSAQVRQWIKVDGWIFDKLLSYVLHVHFVMFF